MDLKPLLMGMCDAKVSDNLKPPPLAMFGGKSDPQEHIISINTQNLLSGLLIPSNEK